jgi:GAF domain-containing protein
MDETLIFSVPKENRTIRYKELIPQISYLLDGELDEIACLANATAAIKEAFSFFWIGFYRVIDNELVLGPFQGPIACTRIQKSRGVCGTAWNLNETILVPDVDLFPGHIACSSASKSEIVIPLRNSKGEVMSVLDIDSDTLNDFTETDQLNLELICLELQKHLYD